MHRNEAIDTPIQLPAMLIMDPNKSRTTDDRRGIRVGKKAPVIAFALAMQILIVWAVVAFQVPSSFH